jgi:hypothetical protein
MVNYHSQQPITSPYPELIESAYILPVLFRPILLLWHDTQKLE